MRPIWSTSRAGPWRSYQAARISLEFVTAPPFGFGAG